jgi:hypothetical protein
LVTRHQPTHLLLSVYASLISALLELVAYSVKLLCLYFTVQQKIALSQIGCPFTFVMSLRTVLCSLAVRHARMDIVISVPPRVWRAPARASRHLRRRKKSLLGRQPLRPFSYALAIVFINLLLTRHHAPLAPVWPLAVAENDGPGRFEARISHLLLWIRCSRASATGTPSSRVTWIGTGSAPSSLSRPHSLRDSAVGGLPCAVETTACAVCLDLG